MLGVLSLVKAGTRYLLVTNAKTDLQRDALLLMRKLAEEFSETNDAAFSVGYNPAGNQPAGQICQHCGAGCDPAGAAFPPGTPFPTGNTAKVGIVFASPRSPVSGDVVYDDTGRMFWPKMVCYYQAIDAGIPCVVRVVSHLPVVVSYPPPPPSLDGFLSTPLPYKVMARNVTLFHCTQAASCMELHLRLDLPSGYGRRYGFEVRSQVFTRN